MRPPAPPSPPASTVRRPAPVAPLLPAPDRAALRRAARVRRRAEAQELARASRRVCRRRRATAVGLGLVVLALAAVAPVLSLTSVFAVRSIEVPGATPAVAAQVRTALAGQLGRPVALVADADVAAALAHVPAVATYAVVRLPPAVLEVRVTQRVGVLQQATTGGWKLEDAAGVVIGTRATRWSVPAVTVAASGPARSGAFATAAAAVTALEGQPSVTIGAVTARSADDVRIAIGGGRTVVWGDADHSAAKAQAVAAALAHAAAGVKQIDVSSPGLVLTR